MVETANQDMTDFTKELYYLFNFFKTKICIVLVAGLHISKSKLPAVRKTQVYNHRSKFIKLPISTRHNGDMINSIIHQRSRAAAAVFKYLLNLLNLDKWKIVCYTRRQVSQQMLMCPSWVDNPNPFNFLYILLLIWLYVDWE